MDTPKVSSALKELETSKVNIKIKKEITDLREECKVLKKQVEMNYSEVESKNEAISNLEKELKKEKSSKSMGVKNLSQPAEELIASSVGFTTLLEQLIGCLLELEDKGEQLCHSKTLLDEYTQKFIPLCVKVRLLYRDFGIAKKNWDEQTAELSKTLESQKANEENLKFEIENLNKVINDLNLDPESIQQRYVIQQRKLIVSEVDHMNLKRKLVSMESSQNYLRKFNAEMQDNMRDIDETARLTITRLYHFKKQATDFAEEIGDKYSDSISLQRYKIMENKLAMYISKTKLLLEREREQVDIYANNENFRLKAEILSEEKCRLEALVKEYQLKADAFDKLSSSVAETGDYLADAYWRPKYVSLEIKASILENRALVAEQKFKSESESEAVV